MLLMLTLQVVQSVNDSDCNQPPKSKPSRALGGGGGGGGVERGAQETNTKFMEKQNTGKLSG